MTRDEYGQTVLTSTEVVDLLYLDPEQDISNMTVADPEQYNRSVAKYYNEFPTLGIYTPPDVTVDEFDSACQSRWYMPEDYKKLDIAKWILDQCSGPEQLQRCGQELLLYQERNLMDLLRYLKYFVDTMRAHSIVWGLGRGSSVSSYVLYLIGVHRVDSMYYDLDPHEFLR